MKLSIEEKKEIKYLVFCFYRCKQEALKSTQNFGMKLKIKLNQ